MWPQINFSLPGFSSNSSGIRDPTKRGRNATAAHPTTVVTAQPTRYVDDFHPPTHPDLPREPAQVLPIASRHSTPAIYPSSGGETSTYAYTTPPPESDTPKVEPEVLIIVMGATGSGKSSFINLASGSDLRVSGGLQSCTNSVQATAPFDLDDRRVVLIDTPGFDDTTQSDTDVLRTIAAFLATTYEQGFVLAGILYFYRISDPRMGGTQTRNFRMFRNLCGESALGNVVIVTNMWGEVEPEVGYAREAELRGEDVFFKPVIEKGAQMARHENTISSAEAIVRLLVNNRPLPLQIQIELVDERKDIVETNAGQELNRELNGQIRKHKEDVRILTEEMEQAAKDKDEETRNELEFETRRMHEEIWKFENEARMMASEYQREKSGFQARLTEMEKVRRGGYRGVGHPQPPSHRGWDYFWPLQPTPYQPPPTFTPATEGRSVIGQGQSSKMLSPRDSREKPGRTSTTKSRTQNMY